MSRWLRHTTPQERAKLGANSISPLVTLTRYGPMRLGDLATRERVAAPTLSRIMSALEENRYATREPDPADRCAALVRATERARSLQQRMERLAAADLVTLLAAVPVLEAMIEDEP